MSRAERRHHIRRLAKHRRNDLSGSASTGYARSLSDNEIATRHPMDCGSRCFMCHGDKLLNAGRNRARQAREWMRDWGLR